MPYGSGEQTMITSAPNVYALMYLKGVGILEATSDQYKRHLATIESGKSFHKEVKKNCLHVIIHHCL